MISIASKVCAWLVLTVMPGCAFPIAATSALLIGLFGSYHGTRLTTSSLCLPSVFTGVKTVVENYTNQRKSSVQALGWNTVYRLTDNWTLSADLSSQKTMFI